MCCYHCMQHVQRSEATVARACCSSEVVKSFSALKVGLGKKAAEHVYVQLLASDEQKFTF